MRIGLHCPSLPLYSSTYQLAWLYSCQPSRFLFSQSQIHFLFSYFFQQSRLHSLCTFLFLKVVASVLLSVKEVLFLSVSPLINVKLRALFHAIFQQQFNSLLASSSIQSLEHKCCWSVIQLSLPQLVSKCFLKSEQWQWISPFLALS